MPLRRNQSVHPLVRLLAWLSGTSTGLLLLWGALDLANGSTNNVIEPRESRQDLLLALAVLASATSALWWTVIAYDRRWKARYDAAWIDDAKQLLGAVGALDSHMNLAKGVLLLGDQTHWSGNAMRTPFSSVGDDVPVVGVAARVSPEQLRRIVEIVRSSALGLGLDSSALTADADALLDYVDGNQSQDGSNVAERSLFADTARKDLCRSLTIACRESNPWAMGFYGRAVRAWALDLPGALAKVDDVMSHEIRDRGAEGPPVPLVTFRQSLPKVEDALLYVGLFVLAIAAGIAWGRPTDLSYEPTALSQAMTSVGAALLTIYGVNVVMQVEIAEELRRQAVLLSDEIWLSMTSLARDSGAAVQSLTDFVRMGPEVRVELGKRLDELQQAIDKSERKAPPTRVLAARNKLRNRRNEASAVAVCLGLSELNPQKICHGFNCVVRASWVDDESCLPYCPGAERAVRTEGFPTMWILGKYLPTLNLPDVMVKTGLMDRMPENPNSGVASDAVVAAVDATKLTLVRLSELAVSAGLEGLSAAWTDIEYLANLVSIWDELPYGRIGLPGSPEDGNETYCGPAGFSSLQILVAFKPQSELQDLEVERLPENGWGPLTPRTLTARLLAARGCREELIKHVMWVGHSSHSSLLHWRGSVRVADQFASLNTPSFRSAQAGLPALMFESLAFQRGLVP